MKRVFLRPLGLALIIALFPSCSSVKSTTKKFTQPAKSLAGLNKNDLMRLKMRDLSGNAPPVVEVRKDKLKKMTSGDEKFLAWNRSRKAARSQNLTGELFMPQDYNPADFGALDSFPTIGILPALNPKSSSSPDIETSSSLPEFPASAE